MLRITYRCIRCLALRKHCFKTIACWVMLTLLLFGPVIANAVRYDGDSESRSKTKSGNDGRTTDKERDVEPVYETDSHNLERYRAATKHSDVSSDNSGENVDIEKPAQNDASDQLRSDTADSTEKLRTSRTTDLTALEIYQKLFQQKRKSHMEALKRITEFGGHEKQYKMVDLLLDKLFAVVTESKASLLSEGFIPGDAFPDSETTREVLSKVVENTAFFGDLLLRFPDITHNLLKKNRDWGITANWAVGFCMEAGIIVGPDSKMLQLVAQELELIPKDPNYRNPYKFDTEKQNKEIKKQLDALLNENSRNKKKQEKKKKKKLQKGPKLSTIRHSEL